MPHDLSLHETALELEKRIRSRRTLPLNVDWAGEIVFPAYDSLSLRNIPHTISDVLGVLMPSPAPLDQAVWGGLNPGGRVDRVVVFLTDGLGYKYLTRLMNEDDALCGVVSDLTDGRGPVPLTSIAPSTTAVALPTLWSGASPAAHGMLGTTLYLREFGTMGNMLSYSPLIGKEPAGSFERLRPADQFISARNLGEYLQEAGIESHNLLYRDYIGSGLSKVLHRGLTHQQPHMGYTDLWLRLEDVLKSTRGQHCYVGIYWGAVDALSHHYGAHNRYVANEVKRQLTDLRDLLAQPTVQDDHTLFMLTADHGHYDAPRVINLMTDKDAAPLRDAMRTPAGGDYRLTYLYLRAGSKQAVLDYCAKHYTDRMVAVDSETALEAGLFGTEGRAAETLHRIGDVILIPRLGWRIIDPTASNWPMISVHAGLSDWEMLTPLLWKRF